MYTSIFLGVEVYESLYFTSSAFGLLFNFIQLKAYVCGHKKMLIR